MTEGEDNFVSCDDDDDVNDGGESYNDDDADRDNDDDDDLHKMILKNSNRFTSINSTILHIF